MDQFKRNFSFYVALILLGVGVYAFNLHGSLFWDDADWILNNVSLHALTWGNIKFIFSHDVLAGIGQVSNYYRPFLFLTFLANYLISGTDPILYHIVSNSIHILNACLIFYLLVRWFGSKRIAFLATLLFLIHPLQTEAVAYISGRGDPLSIFFVLVGITLYLNKHHWWAYGAAILAILSRETAVLFPAYLGVILMAFEYKGLIWERFKKSFVDILPFVGISAVYGLLRLTVLNFQNTLNFYQQQNIYSEHITYRIYTFFHALIVYFRLIFWPAGLHMDRDIPVSLHVWNTWSWLGALIIIGLIVLLVYLYRSEMYKLKSGKSMANVKCQMVNTSAFNVWFFGVGIFFVNLLPTSGIVPINARIYEHWLYFSLFGFFTVVAFYVDRLWSWLEQRKKEFVPVLVIVLTAYCLFLGIQTIRRSILWGDTEAFYLNILSYEPDDVRVLNNLGNWYSDHGNNTDAAPLYQRAIETDPTQPAPYYNLGNIARDNNDLVQAEALYQKAISVDPTFHYAYGNLAQIYLNEKRYTDALTMLERLQQIYPSNQNLQNINIIKKLINKK